MMNDHYSSWKIYIIFVLMIIIGFGGIYLIITSESSTNIVDIKISDDNIYAKLSQYHQKVIEYEDLELSKEFDSVLIHIRYDIGVFGLNELSTNTEIRANKLLKRLHELFDKNDIQNN